MGNIKLSIVTICYNNCGGLKKTAQSIVTQTYANVEWIVIDGGSTDGSVDVINQYENKVSYWISEPDKGIYNAMNKGLERVTGEYIMFLNSGDYLLKSNTIESIIPYLHDKYLYVADICHDIDKKYTPGFKLPENITDQQVLYQLIHFTFPHPASFFKNNYFKRFGCYDETLKIVADWKAYMLGAILGNCSIEIIPLVTTVFDTTGISSSGTQSDNERENAFCDMPRLNELFSFYRNYYTLQTALQDTSIGRGIVRLYYFFYRLFK